MNHSEYLKRLTLKQLELYERLFRNPKCKGYWDEENQILVTPDDIETINKRRAK